MSCDRDLRASFCRRILNQQRRGKNAWVCMAGPAMVETRATPSIRIGASLCSFTSSFMPKPGAAWARVIRQVGQRWSLHVWRRLVVTPPRSKPQIAYLAFHAGNLSKIAEEGLPGVELARL